MGINVGEQLDDIHEGGIPERLAVCKESCDLGFIMAPI